MLRAGQPEPKGLIVFGKYSRDKSVKSALTEGSREAISRVCMNLMSTKTQRGSRRDAGLGIRAPRSLPTSVGGAGDSAHGGGEGHENSASLHPD